MYEANNNPPRQRGRADKNKKKGRKVRPARKSSGQNQRQDKKSPPRPKIERTKTGQKQA